MHRCLFVPIFLLACSRNPAPPSSSDATKTTREPTPARAVVIPPGWKTRLEHEGPAHLAVVQAARR